MTIVGRCAKQKLVGCGVVTGTARASIEKVGGGSKGIRPKRKREGGLVDERPHAVIEGSKNTLGAAILLRRVWTGQPQHDVVLDEECA